jgi:hypothetical protein
LQLLSLMKTAPQKKRKAQLKKKVPIEMPKNYELLTLSEILRVRIRQVSEIYREDFYKNLKSKPYLLLKNQSTKLATKRILNQNQKSTQ